MTPKKRKIYIAIIITCLLSTGGVLYFGFFRASSAPPTPPDISLGAGAAIPGNQSSNTLSSSQGSDTGYSAPAVFPNDTKFDWTLLEQSTFKTLKGIPDLVLGPLGRPNPFSPY